jgi:hypothetical protein
MAFVKVPSWAAMQMVVDPFGMVIAPVAGRVIVPPGVVT